MSPPSATTPRRRSRTRRVLLYALPLLWFVIRPLWAPLDVVAVGLPLVGAAALVGGGVVAAFSRRRWPLAIGASIAAVALAATLLPRIPTASEAPASPITIASANVLLANPTPEAAATVLVGRDVDVLVVVEMGDGMPSAIGSMTDLRYSYTDGGIGVWSRWPLAHSEKPNDLIGQHVERLEVTRPGDGFVLYVGHADNPLFDPTFAEQRDLSEALANAVVEDPEPAVIVGDLNLSDRTQGYATLDGDLRDAMRAGHWADDTYPWKLWRFLFLRIDHLFVPDSWCAVDPSTFDVPGSDHDGIQATVGPCDSSGPD